MKLNLVLGGIAVVVAAIAVSIPVVNEAQSRQAAAEILEDYKLCDQGYELLGKEEAAAKLLNTKDEPSGHREYLATLRSVEASCARYNRYLNRWGTFKIVPSESLVLALVSRYEPERLKQK